MDVTYIPIVIQAGKSSELSYVYGHEQDLKLAKELYEKHRSYKLYNGWVMIGGIAINGINKYDMERIICECEM